MTILVVALIAVTAQTSPPDKLPGQPCTSAALVGTWTMAEQTVGGQETPIGPSNPVEYKQVTPTHFFVYQVAPGPKPIVAWAHGGAYALPGGTYTESIEHGFGEPFKALGGQSIPFQCSIEGTDTWHIAGQIGGMPFRETWKRVKPDRNP
jgi:hypothetical protein